MNAKIATAEKNKHWLFVPSSKISPREQLDLAMQSFAYLRIAAKSRMISMCLD